MAFTLLQVWEDMPDSGQFSVPRVGPSPMDWTFRRGARKSTFTVCAVPDRVRLESLGVSATVRMGCFVVMRSSGQLGKVRRTAHTVMNRQVPFQRLTLGPSGFSNVVQLLE